MTDNGEALDKKNHEHEYFTIEFTPELKYVVCKHCATWTKVDYKGVRAVDDDEQE